jgi:hypothetical protein
MNHRQRTCLENVLHSFLQKTMVKQLQWQSSKVVLLRKRRNQLYGELISLNLLTSLTLVDQVAKS